MTRLHITKRCPICACPALVTGQHGAKSALDQHYPKPDVAAKLYDKFEEHFDPEEFLMVEPSAGQGAFFQLLPPGSLGYGLEPKYPGILKRDFLTVELPANRSVAVIGNPPFGRNASTAVHFFNHAAHQCDVIAMIFPRSFRKESIKRRLDPAFHLVYEGTVPHGAFLHQGKSFHALVVFQIWVRGAVSRRRRTGVITHPDFAFATPDQANLVVQRVGAEAGKVHKNFDASPNSHYFIRGDVENIMAQLNFAKVAANATGNPSLAKTEIVAMYCEFVSDAHKYPHRVQRGLHDLPD